MLNRKSVTLIVLVLIEAIFCFSIGLSINQELTVNSKITALEKKNDALKEKRKTKRAELANLKMKIIKCLKHK
ncbi:hypothetical protein ACLZX5_00315 [Enterococcus faecium]